MATERLRRPQTGLWWALGGLTVVGLYVYMRGRQTPAAGSSGPTGQVPTAIGQALAPQAAGQGDNTDNSTGDTPTSPGDTALSSGLGSDYQTSAAAQLGLSSGAYGGPSYATSSSGNSLAPLSIISGPTAAQAGGPPILNLGGFPSNPAGGYNPGGGIAGAKGL